MFDSPQVFENIIDSPIDEYCIIQAIVDDKYRDTLQRVAESISLATYFETNATKLMERFRK